MQERKERREGEDKDEEKVKGATMEREIKEELEKFGERMTRLELEGEKKRRKEEKRNVILREVEIK